MARLPLGSRRINIESAGVEILKKIQKTKLPKNSNGKLRRRKKVELTGSTFNTVYRKQWVWKTRNPFFQMSSHNTYLTFQLGYVSLSKVYQGEE